jgi:hypothetical protein
MFDGNLLLVFVLGLILAAEFVNGWTERLTRWSPCTVSPPRQGRP